ncbi:cut9 interacting protein Scn1 [Mucor ambiguus]|uniref:Cut9 interacting protein Scn1 n=1 Tax=Mucor ambiguus TaxID=91626 RepID=A0A0C9MEM0_9FUNG|nr:cut9 interacting protein Scn1 [Mucor ambiguus]
MCQSSDFLNHGVPTSDEAFDEVLFQNLCDSHCHPHDDIEHLPSIPQLKTGHITIMGVRQDDWDTVSKVAHDCNRNGSNRCIPCFGIHPWFSHFVMTQKESTQAPDDYYKDILKSSNQDEINDMIRALEKPFSYNEWYSNLKQRVEEHPNALVGEAGVDRSARLLPGGSIDWHGKKPTSVQTSIEHQLAVFDIQCQLARDLNRGISVHCVQGQGHLFTHLKNISTQFSARQLKKLKVVPNTLRMCLHSYGGAPATITQFLELKGFEIYVSFSVAINARLVPAKKLVELIKTVPEDRLLIESDLNTPLGIDECMVEMTKIVAEARGWTIKHVVETTNRNWKRFVNV